MSTFTICVLFFFIFVQMVIGADPLYHLCSSNNFTRNSPYDQSLKKLLGDLYKTPSNGFGMSSVGGYQAQTTFGLSMCRGDVSSKDCMACVVDASAEILKRCPNNKAATIWYDHCLLRYSNIDFFGQIDSQVKLYMWNLNNVSDPTSFNLATKSLLNGLSSAAYADPKLMYAAGAIDLKGSQKIYGVVQCARDLSPGQCKICLDSAISELPKCCDGKQGGRVISGSCNIRYEIYPFISV